MPEKSCSKARRLTRKEIRELDIKISFMEGIVQRDTNYVEALQILGDHYTQRGKYQYSLNVDKQLSELEPANPLVFYNLACSYCLNCELASAADALDRAINLGYRDFRWLSKDPDLTPLRKHPLYRRLEDKIKRMKVRVA